MAGNRFANLPATAARLLGMNAGSDHGDEPEQTEAVNDGDGENVETQPAGDEPAAEAAMDEAQVQAVIDATKAQADAAWTAKIAAVFGHENAKGREAYAAELLQEASLSADRITALLGKTPTASAESNTDEADGAAMLDKIAGQSAPVIGASTNDQPPATANAAWDRVIARMSGANRH